MIKHSQKLFTVALIACAITACKPKPDSQADSAASTAPAVSIGASAPAPSTQPINSPDGRLSISIPSGMEEKVSNKQVKVYTSESGSVTLAEVDAPASSSLDGLIDQTEANLKAQDGAMQVINKSEQTISGVKYKLLEVGMTMSGAGKVYTATALFLHDGKLLSVQLLGPKDEQKALSETAKAMLGSIKLTPAK